MKKEQGGFTLMELLVGISIAGILLAALYSVFTSQQEAFSVQEQVAEMNQNARAALDLMTREIRLAGYKDSTSTFNGIQRATPDTLRVFADLDLNGDTSGPDEDITYSYDPGTLQVCRNGVGLPIAENSTNLSFSYTLGDGSVTSSPVNLGDIRKVTISIVCRTAIPDRRTGVYRTITLTTDVTPRNLAT